MKKDTVKNCASDHTYYYLTQPFAPPDYQPPPTVPNIYRPHPLAPPPFVECPLPNCPDAIKKAPNQQNINPVATTNQGLVEKTKTFKKAGNGLVDECCTICFEQVNQRGRLVPCGHASFCFGCSQKISRQKQPTCPLCRTLIVQVNSEKAQMWMNFYLTWKFHMDAVWTIEYQVTLGLDNSFGCSKRWLYAGNSYTIQSNFRRKCAPQVDSALLCLM